MRVEEEQSRIQGELDKDKQKKLQNTDFFCEEDEKQMLRRYQS